jgi:hypothetical protein
VLTDDCHGLHNEDQVPVLQRAVGEGVAPEGTGDAIGDGAPLECAFVGEMLFIRWAWDGRHHAMHSRDVQKHPCTHHDGDSAEGPSVMAVEAEDQDVQRYQDAAAADPPCTCRAVTNKILDAEVERDCDAGPSAPTQGSNDKADCSQGEGDEVVLVWRVQRLVGCLVEGFLGALLAFSPRRNH